LVLLLLSDLILLAAARLNLTRDLGEGIIPAKPGRRDAKKSLLSPLGLAVRNVRNILIGWVITAVLLGASYGSIFGDFGGFIEGNDMFRQMLDIEELSIEELMTMLGGNEELLTILHTGSELSMDELMEMLSENEHVKVALKERELEVMERFATLLMSIMSVFAAVPACIILLKVRNEEKKGRNEHILARGVTKPKLLSGYFVISIITGIVVMFSIVFGLWGAAYTVMEKPFAFAALFASGMVYIPAIYIMIAIAMILNAYLPRSTSMVWVYLGFSGFVIYLGKLLKFPGWIAKISPYGHVPQIPVDNMNWTNIIVLSAIAVVFMTLGFMKYKKRDMVI